MNIAELKEAISKWPEDYEVMVNFQAIDTVACMEGRTSDGPGTLNIQGIEE